MTTSRTSTVTRYCEIIGETVYIDMGYAEDENHKRHRIFNCPKKDECGRVKRDDESFSGHDYSECPLYTQFISRG